MESIAKSLERYVPIPPQNDEKKGKRGITNKRQWVLKQFEDEINRERMGTKFKPIKGNHLAVKLSHKNVFELEQFLSTCRDYKNRKGSFNKAFFGSLKVEK